jgi:hypothetical protein
MGMVELGVGCQAILDFNLPYSLSADGEQRMCSDEYELKLRIMD